MTAVPVIPSARLQDALPWLNPLVEAVHMLEELNIAAVEGKSIATRKMVDFRIAKGVEMIAVLEKAFGNIRASATATRDKGHALEQCMGMCAACFVFGEMIVYKELSTLFRHELEKETKGRSM